MKIAIHKSKGFSKRWISYCEANGISFKIVDCYQSDIIHQMDDCDVLMWHFSQDNYKDMLFARQLVYSLEQAGKIVFPNFFTSWHFDDKVGQKYLLESVGAPMVPANVFFDKPSAMKWASTADFPKVFKLRGGAGSANVKLVKTKRKAVSLIEMAFGRGFPPFDKWEYFKERVRKTKEGKDSLLGIAKGIGRLFIKPHDYTMMSNEKGYVYFQDFMPDNLTDTRVIVIGDKAFGIVRKVRENDFRASGSGSIIYDHSKIDMRCVKIAFETNRKLKAQCLAYDFVFDKQKNPLIVEISYGFVVKAYDLCEGYWDSDLEWHEGKFNPQGWMVGYLIQS